ncbi:MAG: hypothetical protein LHW55_06480 [Candidatus Cloacimonetes bacterium]|nr:hypothetical protein [Candidatus Cloacimonadota bacterium]
MTCRLFMTNILFVSHINVIAIQLNNEQIGYTPSLNKNNDKLNYLYIR